MTEGNLPEYRFTLDVGFDKGDIQKMLTLALDFDCSDIRVQSGDYVTVYWKRQWIAFSNRALEHAEVERALHFLCGASAVTQIGSGREIDESPEFFREDAHRVRIRFRLNAVGCRVGRNPNGISMILRTIPTDLPELSRMNLPADLEGELMPSRGLVLVSGATGSGKSTLIAGAINEQRKAVPGPAVLTYEDPVEFDYGITALGDVPLVSQVHIGKHIEGWSRAGPTAMRRKGDLILMGEVRDRETAESTMEMAITGHLVYGTIHADTPNETVFRLVEMFPEEVRSAAASKMLSSLRLICSQKLIRTLSGKIQPLRSWISFDAEMKDLLSSPDYPYPRWAAYVRQILREKKQDFASACVPFITCGELDVKMFREITLMGKDEAKRYFDDVVANGSA